MKQFTIYYVKPSKLTTEDHLHGMKVTRESMKDSHVKVATVYAHRMEDTFDLMNGYGDGMPNPLECANAQKFIGESGANHTSMMVNDMVEDEEGNLFICQSYGWGRV